MPFQRWRESKAPYVEEGLTDLDLMSTGVQS